MKKLCGVLLMILVVLLGIQVVRYMNYSLKKEDLRISNEERDKQESEILKISSMLEEEIVRKQAMAIRCAENISNQIEIVLLTETGSASLKHDKTPENKWWLDWLIDSNVEIFSDYQLIITIPVEAICTYFGDDFVLYIVYDESKISIKTVELMNTLTDSWTAAYGQKYSPEEVVALLQIMKNQIYKDGINDIILFETAKDNLNAELIKIVTDIGFEVDEFEIMELRDSLI